MKRNPRKMKWTKAYRKLAGKEMVLDSTFEFEKKRNRPVKYDRELMQKTLKAMKRVEEIRVRRAADHYATRMRVKHKLELQQAQKELERDVVIVRSSMAKSLVPTKAKVSEPVAMEVEKKPLLAAAAATTTGSGKKKAAAIKPAASSALAKPKKSKSKRK